MALSDTALSADDKIVHEAQSRFTRCVAWETTARERGDLDERFYWGDAYNNYQWDSDAISARTSGTVQKPCLTINKSQQHCLQIVNDGRQNKQGIKIVATGGSATYDAAQAYMGLVRAIERNSNAQVAYDTASWNAVVRGIGYIRVLTEYEHEETTNQTIKIQRVPDTKMVYLDPDIQEYDGRDARFGFVGKNLPRDEFKARYPKFDDIAGGEGFGFETSWDNEHHVRECEYWRKTLEDDELLALHDGSMVRKSQAGPVHDSQVRARRKLQVPKIEQFLLVGHKIVDRTVWKGRYIPIARVVGQESVIDNEMDRRGHIRALISPQQNLNYYASCAVESVALQTKTPWLVDAQSVEGLEEYWNTANTVNHAYIPWNSFDTDTGRELKEPHRTDPPQMPQAYIEGLKIAQQEMMLVSGQYQAVMGEQSNETSGVAIDKRQRQGDNATYHFIDHLALAIRFVGEIVVDLIPHVMDTMRVERILQEDGEEGDLIVDPNAPQAHMHISPPGPQGQPPQPMSPQDVEQAKRTKGGMEGVKAIFNPTIGKYGVAADVGPSYATTRQEAFHSMMTIVQAAPDMMHTIGDLMFRSSDMPLADEIADRLHNMIPPQALGGPSPELQQAQQHIQTLSTQVTALTAQVQMKHQNTAADMAKTAGQLQIDEYKAETDRMAVVAAAEPDAMRVIIHELVMQAMQTRLPDLLAQHGLEPTPGPQTQFDAANAPPPAAPPAQ